MKELSARRDSLATEVGDLKSEEKRARALNQEIRDGEKKSLELRAASRWKTRLMPT